jgi:hypothetical protein
MKKIMKKFFSFLWNKKQSKSEKINNLIANDPVIKKLDQEIGELNNRAAERLRKDKEAVKILKELGIDI